MTLQEAIEKAKLLGSQGKREWISGNKLCSYGSNTNSVEFFILEGSPPRAYIIAIEGLHVTLLDAHLNEVKTFLVGVF